MTIVLYEFSPTRSERVRWILQELEAQFESRTGQELFGSDELKAVHPQGKLPAILDDGRPLFESAAICTWLADKHADKGLGFETGTWERALHEQWVAFTLSELEAHLWSSARNTFIYPEDARLKGVIVQNDQEARNGLKVLNDHLSGHDYMVADRFSVTDVIVAFATNWAQGTGLVGDFPHVAAYNQRMLARDRCPMTAE